MKEASALEGLVLELRNARDTHENMVTPHEGYAIIKEELEELWDEIKKKEPDREEMRKEALQVAATAIRFIEDLL